MEGEFLPAERRLDQHAATRVGMCNGAVKIRSPGRGRLDENHRCVGSEADFVFLEALQRILVAEQDQLAERLTADLHPERHLGQGREPDGFAVFEHLAVPSPNGKHGTRPTDGWEHGVAVGLVEELLEPRIPRREPGESRL